MRTQLIPYMDLLREFGQQNISAADFEAQYLSMYKEDGTSWTSAEFVILDKLFGAVDAFCADPELRDESDLDEVQLLEAAKSAWMNLGKIT